MANTATAVTAAFVLLLSVSCRLAATEAPAPPPSMEGCTGELVSFSACLSYVSDPPNNVTDSAPAKCCDAFSSAAEYGGAICLCYFVRYPNILGFPLNTTRLLSLSSVCAPPPPPSPSAPLSLNFLCSASPALPPLNSAEPLGNSKSGWRGAGGRPVPESGGGRSPNRSRESGGAGFYFALSNGAIAASPHLSCINTLLLSLMLAILVNLHNTV